MRTAVLVNRIYTGETYVPEGRKHPKQVVLLERHNVEILEETPKRFHVKYLEGELAGKTTWKRKYKIELNTS